MKSVVFLTTVMHEFEFDEQFNFRCIGRVLNTLRSVCYWVFCYTIHRFVSDWKRYETRKEIGKSSSDDYVKSNSNEIT